MSFTKLLAMPAVPRLAVTLVFDGLSRSFLIEPSHRNSNALVANVAG